jgi:hypothetical protein
VQVSALSDVRAPTQASLFGGAAAHGGEPGEQKLARATEALDDLRERYGAGTVVPGSLLKRASLRVRAREGEQRG